MVEEVSSIRGKSFLGLRDFLVGEPRVATGTTQFEGRLSAPININVENSHDAWKSKYAPSIHARTQMKGRNLKQII